MFKNYRMILVEEEFANQAVELLNDTDIKFEIPKTQTEGCHKLNVTEWFKYCHISVSDTYWKDNIEIITSLNDDDINNITKELVNNDKLDDVMYECLTDAIDRYIKTYEK